MGRETACTNCGSSIRPAMVRCRECGEVVLEEGLSLPPTVNETRLTDEARSDQRDTVGLPHPAIPHSMPALPPESVFHLNEVDDELDDDEVLEVQPDTFDAPEPEESPEPDSELVEESAAVTESASIRRRGIVIRPDTGPDHVDSASGNHRGQTERAGNGEATAS
jgi:hypothetical protein